jgi:hypothetical protein
MTTLREEILAAIWADLPNTEGQAREDLIAAIGRLSVIGN